MKLKNKYVISLLIVSLMTIITYLSYYYFESAKELTEVTFTSEELYSFETLDNKHIIFNEIKDTIVIVNFWATWCTPCLAEIPDLVAIQEEYEGVKIIGISIDDYEDDVKKFARTYKINYPLMMYDQRMAALFGPIDGVPTSIIYNQKLEMIKKVVGYQPKSFFEAEIEALTDVDE